MRIIAKNTLTTVDPSNILSHLLESRGISDIESFLNPPSPTTFSLTQFGYQKEAEVLCSKLQEVYDKKQTVVVYCDYDCDGITGGTILWETLHKLGFTVMPYTPDRVAEGYGFSKVGIDAVLAKHNPSLILSVDHGIVAKEQIEYAKSVGIDVIVTDHHHKDEAKLPTSALAVIHIPELSGSGVAYVVAKEIFECVKSQKLKVKSGTHPVIPDSDPGSRSKLTNDGIPHQVRDDVIEELNHLFKTDYVAIAATGTIADLVPLVGPSRGVVKFGLAAYPKVKRPGIATLLELASLTGKPIGTYEVGFLIAPRINAVGRLTHALDALRLLCTTSKEKAHLLGAKVNDLNTTRQDMVKEATQTAIKMVEALPELPNILVIVSPGIHQNNSVFDELHKSGGFPPVSKNETGIPSLTPLTKNTKVKHEFSEEIWHEGIIGLIASKLVEKYYRPTIVITKGEGTILKASCRSIAGFHMTEFLALLQDYLVGYGGHAMAAGFTIKQENLGAFTEAAEDAAADLVEPEMLIRTLEVDADISLAIATKSLFTELAKLEPFGVGNSKPTFLSRGVLCDARSFGKTSDHFKILIREDKDNSGKFVSPLEGIAFGKAVEYADFKTGQIVKLVYELETNVWNGRESLRCKVRHIELQ